MRQSLGRSDYVRNLMSCARCGRADFEPEHLFIVNHGSEDPELSRAINAALRAQGIDGEERLGQLCEECFQISQACIQEGSRVYASAHRDLALQRYQAALGRPLTAAERQKIEAYLGQSDG